MEKNHLLKQSIKKLLRPLVKVLLRYGVAYQELDAMVKETFVEVIDSDYRLK